MAVTKRLRYEVLRRDNHACRYCGATAPDVKLTVDHVLPKALGGKDEASNLVTACAPCNAGKSSSSPDQPLVDDVSSDALRWGQARKMAIDTWRAGRANREAQATTFGEAWDSWGSGEGDDRRTVPKDPDWVDSVTRWLDEGFTVDDLVSLIPKAMRKPRQGRRAIAWDERWTYYCGVVWRTLDEVQAGTERHLDPPAAPTGPAYAPGTHNLVDYGDMDPPFIDQPEQWLERDFCGFLWGPLDMNPWGRCVICKSVDEVGVSCGCVPCWIKALKETEVPGREADGGPLSFFDLGTAMVLNPVPAVGSCFSCGSASKDASGFCAGCRTGEAVAT